MVLTSEQISKGYIIKTESSKINYENANMFSKQAVELIENENPTCLAIDFSDITYISSIGISALSVIKGISKLNNCKLVLFGINEDISTVLEQTGLNTMFKILASKKEVLEYFNEEEI